MIGALALLWLGGAGLLLAAWLVQRRVLAQLAEARTRLRRLAAAAVHGGRAAGAPEAWLSQAALGEAARSAVGRRMAAMLPIAELRQWRDHSRLEPDAIAALALLIAGDARLAMQLEIRDAELRSEVTGLLRTAGAVLDTGPGEGGQ